jgi:tetratricopeptide (TPR) repeat protein
MAVAFLVLIGATVVSIRSANQARDEAERSRTTQRILADVFEQADPFGDGGAEVTQADALIRAKPGIEEKVMDEPRLAWEENRTLAGIFTNLDLQYLEREAFQAAWDAALELEGANEREVLFGVAGIGNILTRNDPATALTFFAEHLPKLPASPEGAAEWLSAKYAEVSALIRLRDYAGADQGARDMQRVAVEFSVDAPRTLARIDQLLAGAARRAGDVAAADRHWASSVANMQRAATPIGLAVTLSNQALHFGMTGRFAESEAAFQESIAIFREHAPDHTSHANIQRLYAGLLYRMRRPDEALGALRETLSILDPDEESYTYVVAQIARADVAFAKGDTAQTFAAIEQSSDVAVATFSPNSDVTQRILPVLARLLLFAGYPGEAAQAVGVGSGDSCTVEQGALHEIDAAVSRLADNTAAETARQTAWSKVHALEQLAADGNLNANAFSNAADELRAWQSVFIDVLDRYQILNALHDLGQQIAGGVPAGLREERARVSALRRETRGMLAADGRARLDRVLSMLHPGYVKRSC